MDQLVLVQSGDSLHSFAAAITYKWLNILMDAHDVPFQCSSCREELWTVGTSVVCLVLGRHMGAIVGSELILCCKEYITAYAFKIGHIGGHQAM